MPGYMLTWNPNQFDWSDYSAMCKKTSLDKTVCDTWRCRNSNIKKGDQIFMLRQGVDPRGIIGSGRAVSGVFLSKDRSRTSVCEIEFNRLLDVDMTEPLSLEMFSNSLLPRAVRHSRFSGIRIPDHALIALNKAWKDHLDKAGVKRFEAHRSSHESTQQDIDGMLAESYSEGKRVSQLTNTFERNPSLARAAKRIHGTVCKVCGFDFGKTYGLRGMDYIEVHHLKPLYVTKKQRHPDPAQEMTVLCSNCHRMVHRRKDDPLSIERLRGMIEKSGRGR